MPPFNSAGHETRNNWTLLFVDDDSAVLSALRRLFRINGYAVLIANGGAEGLQLLEREQVDLVISDMRMPGMNGAAFLKQVRARWPECIRILLTGYADATSLADAVSQGGIHHFVDKPWLDDQLLSLVRQALEHKEA